MTIKNKNLSTALSIIFFLKILNIIDEILIFFLPNIFALNRTIVLKKINEDKK